MLARSCDRRCIHSKRGYRCTDELDSGLPFADPTAALFGMRCSPAAVAPPLVGAERMPVVRCGDLGLVDAAIEPEGRGAAARGVAASRAPEGTRKDLMREADELLFRDALAVLRQGGDPCLSLAARSRR